MVNLSSLSKIISKFRCLILGDQKLFDNFRFSVRLRQCLELHAWDAATALLYAGEIWDAHSQQYYLRARYYDQNIGRFNRMDPFGGNNQDPQSLHKYLYAHCNPTNNIDPSGNFAFYIKSMKVMINLNEQHCEQYLLLWVIRLSSTSPKIHSFLTVWSVQLQISSYLVRDVNV